MVGNKDQLLNNKLLASKLSWVSGAPPPPTELINIKAKIRYRAPEAAVKLSISDGVAEIQFYQPQRAIAPGQAIVLYQGNTVLGGGIIEDS